MEKNPNSWRLIAMFFVMFMLFVMGPIQGYPSAGDVTADQRVQVNSPPITQTTIIAVSIESPAVLWLCTSTPGDRFTASVSTDAIVQADMPSMTCDIYYSIEKVDSDLSTLSGFESKIDKYPFCSDLGLRSVSQRELISSLNSQSSFVLKDTQRGVNTRLDIGERGSRNGVSVRHI